MDNQHDQCASTLWTFSIYTRAAMTGDEQDVSSWMEMDYPHVNSGMYKDNSAVHLYISTFIVFTGETYVVPVINSKISWIYDNAYA